jgi:hypothetical protein
VIFAAGIISVFRGLALIVASYGNMYGPVVIAVALFFPVGCGLGYCWLAWRIRRGNRTDLTVIVVASAILFLPSLALGFLIEVTVLGQLLYVAQAIAVIVHQVLLGWIVYAGIRLLGAMTAHAAGIRHVTGPGTPDIGQVSLGANLLLMLVGLVVGFSWTLGCFLLGDHLELRGPKSRLEWGSEVGKYDDWLAAIIVLLSASVFIAFHLLSRRRWWGVMLGFLAGLTLGFIALTN